MARPADVLALLTEANKPNGAFAQTAKLRRAVAELPEGVFEQARTLAENLPPEPMRRDAAELDRAARPVFEETQKLRQMVAEHHKRMAQTIKAVEFAVIRGRIRASRSECSGTRARAPRGRAVRRRGSRRGAVATRAGPDDSSGDPEPAGLGAPVGDTSRVLRTFVGRRA